MFYKRRIMKALIEHEKAFHDDFMPVYNIGFFNARTQDRIIDVCKTLVTEEQLAQWANGSYTSLRIKATPHGTGYFSRKRGHFRDKAIGFAFGVLSTILTTIIINWITSAI